MSRYTFDRKFADVFRRAGIDLGLLLRRSQLPEDLFGRRDITLTRTEYFRLVETLGAMERDIPGLAERIAVDGRIETFAPPVFAAYCSDNGLTFLERLAHYKKLVGPVKIHVADGSALGQSPSQGSPEGGETVTITVASDDDHEPLPPFFARLELLFILGVLRRATETDIALVATSPNSVVLRRADLLRPFVSRNDAMWQYFEPELRRRLSEMQVDDSMAARVRSALVELLPAGKTAVDDVASKLCMSKRTLQRRLADERTTFQQQLNNTRLLLAKNYLRTSDRTSDDIAFLLGYEDTTSFLRAFSTWTGQTVSDYRRKP